MRDTIDLSKPAKLHATARQGADADHVKNPPQFCGSLVLESLGLEVVSAPIHVWSTNTGMCRTPPVANLQD